MACLVSMAHFGADAGMRGYPATEPEIQAIWVSTEANMATCNAQGSLGDSTTRYVPTAP
jgi:hypothetical protein